VRASSFSGEERASDSTPAYGETSCCASPAIKIKNGVKYPRRGFTLVEVLLALGIFSMLILALYSTWILVVRATIVGKGTAARLQRERVAMHTIEDALTCIQSHQASIDYYLFNIQNGDQPLLGFTAYLPDTFPRTGEFVGMTPGGGTMDYHLRRLTFSLQPDEQGGNDLVLRQTPILMDLTPAEVSTPLVLAKNVTAFAIECWDTNAMQWATEWDATNMLPPLVRVTVGFGNPSTGSSQVITRLISFPSSTMPSQVQTPNYNGMGNAPWNNSNPLQGGPQKPGSYNPYGPQTSLLQDQSPVAMSGSGPPPNLGPPLLPDTVSQVR
jgi:prepilin-type N-terminal cleavage/methylation domain-containing protein